MAMSEAGAPRAQMDRGYAERPRAIPGNGMASILGEVLERQEVMSKRAASLAAHATAIADELLGHEPKNLPDRVTDKDPERANEPTRTKIEATRYHQFQIEASLDRLDHALERLTKL